MATYACQGDTYFVFSHFLALIELMQGDSGSLS